MSQGQQRRSIVTWLRQHPVRAAGIVFAAGLIVLNVVAYQHARAMMRFVDGGARTLRPQKLSVLGKVGVLLTGVRVSRPENDRTPDDVELKFETVMIPVSEDVRLEAWSVPVESPRGTVLLFHGYADSKSSLLPEAVAFHEMGLHVWLIDFRGSGGSSEQYTTIGFVEGEDVAAAVKHARAASSTKPLVLYGRSMGAAAILRGIAAHDVDADGAILESVFDRLRSTAGNRFHLMGLPAFPCADLLVFWGGVQRGFSGHKHNPVDYAARCECPTLLLHGEFDPNARLKEALAVQSHLGDRAAHLETFPNMGHSPTLAADSHRWHTAVERFLSGRICIVTDPRKQSSHQPIEKQEPVP